MATTTTTTSVTITTATNILYDIVEIKTIKGKYFFKITLNKNVVIAVGSLVVGFVSIQKIYNILFKICLNTHKRPQYSFIHTYSVFL